MNIKELKLKKDPELKNLLFSFEKNLQETKFKILAREEKNTAALKKIRKNIAQILTILREREINEADKR